MSFFACKSQRNQWVNEYLKVVITLELCNVTTHTQTHSLFYLFFNAVLIYKCSKAGYDELLAFIKY